MAGAETVKLLKGTRCTHQKIDGDGLAKFDLDLTLDAVRFLIDRASLNYYNLIEKSLITCNGDRDAAEDRECKAQRANPSGSLLELLGWKVIIPTMVAVIAIGVAVGFGIARALPQDLPDLPAFAF